MKKVSPHRSRFLLGFFAIAAILLAHAGSTSGETADATRGPLAQVLQPLVDKSAMSGAVVLVADRERVLDVESVGWASLESKEPMRNDALFWIASMTKSVTATALMMLVDEGKVNVHDPLEKYLPEFKGQTISEDDGKAPPHPPKHPITIQEILSHTSGVVLAGNPVLRGATTLQDEVAAIAAAPLRREPGTKYEYNNCGINTAGRIIEVTSGLPYAEFVQTRLLDPLEMKETTFWPDDEAAKRLVRSSRRAADGQTLEDAKLDKNLTPEVIERVHRQSGVPLPLIADFGAGKGSDYTNHYAMPAGGLYSTAGDLAKFCQMLLNRGEWHGRRYLSEAAVAEMSANRTREILVSPVEAYGLGWSVKIRADEGPSIGSFGHRGARRTAMWIDPTNQLVMIVMLARMDMTGPEQQELYRSFMQAAIAKWGEPVN